MTRYRVLFIKLASNVKVYRLNCTFLPSPDLLLFCILVSDNDPFTPLKFNLIRLVPKCNVFYEKLWVLLISYWNIIYKL